MATKIECPECQGLLRVWIEIDADISFEVSRTGRLSKRQVQDNGQDDGRSGFVCPACRWEVHNHDLDDDDMRAALEAAVEQYQALRLTAVKAKD